MKNDLGVAPGREAMAAAGELLAQRAVVVDLAVQDEPQRAVFVGERLLAAFEVDDAQAAEAQAGVGAREEAVAVRAAVAEGGRHPAEERRVVEAREAADAAHGRPWPRRSGSFSHRPAPRNPPPLLAAAQQAAVRVEQDGGGGGG